MPRSARAVTRPTSSARTSEAVALPSKMIALTGLLSPAAFPGLSRPVWRSRTVSRPVLAGSVPEVPDAGEVQAHPGLRRGLDDLGVADRPARLDDRLDAGLRQHQQAIGEREERIAGPDRAGRPLTSPGDREASR